MSSEVVPLEHEGDSEGNPADTGASRRKLLTGMGAAAAGAGILAVAGASPAQAVTDDGRYFSLRPGPFRYIDTRGVAGGNIEAGETRSYTDIAAGDSQITIVLNVTVVNTVGYGYLTIYDGNARRPAISNVNWQGNGKVMANLVITDLGATGIKVFAGGSAGSNTDFIVDVIGYFFGSGNLPPTQQALQSRMKKAAAKGTYQ